MEIIRGTASRVIPSFSILNHLGEIVNKNVVNCNHLRLDLARHKNYANATKKYALYQNIR